MSSVSISQIGQLIGLAMIFAGLFWFFFIFIVFRNYLLGKPSWIDRFCRKEPRP